MDLFLQSSSFKVIVVVVGTVVQLYFCEQVRLVVGRKESREGVKGSCIARDLRDKFSVGRGIAR